MKIEGAPGVITIFDVKKCRPVPARMQQGLLPPDLLREQATYIPSKHCIHKHYESIHMYYVYTKLE